MDALRGDDAQRKLAAAGHVPSMSVVGDGTEWLRRPFDEWFPNAVRIVGRSFSHAAEYLCASGRRLRSAKRWAAEPCRRRAALDSRRPHGPH